MKKLNLLALAALVLFGLSGCEKEKIENVASADVFVKSIKNTQGVTVYTPVHSVFSYNTMKSVSVALPAASSTVQLKNFENGGNSFFNEPADADYLPTLPAAGSYSYFVKFNDGEEKTYTNTLSATSLLPANITSLAKTANGDSLYITWDAIASTHAYQLKIMKGTTQVYYRPAFVDGTTPLKASLKLGFLLSSLTSNVSGTYTFELTGLLFETTAYDYIQAISTATKGIAL